jgi:P4 family phage/plasmid primase-like protien
MPTYTEAEQFLKAVFADWEGRAVFAHSVSPRGMTHFRDIAPLDVMRDCYWSVAAFPDDGSAHRTTARASGVRALVIDDVGTKVAPGAVLLALGSPTAAVETSAGNYQWAYRLAKPVAVGDWAGFFAGVEVLVGQKLEGRDAVHLFRLPMGLNTKKGRGRFAVRLAELNALTELDPAGVLHRCVVAAGAPGASSSGPGPSSSSSSSSSGPEPRIRDIKNFMKLIPNPDVDYDAWIARAHQVKALALDEASGEEAFDLWSRKSAAKYDAAETARRWATVRPSRTAGMGLLADAEAADPAGFARVMNREAGAAFDDDPPPPPPPLPSSSGGGGGGGTTHVDMAEAIIGRERGTLGWLSNASSRWAGFDPVMGRWVVEEHDALMRAAVRDAVHHERAVAAPAAAKRMAEAKWRGAVQGLLVRERRLLLPFERFDAELDVFGVPGGVVRLGSGGIVEEAGTASQMVSKTMAVRPAPRGVRGVAWERFLDDFTMGDAELRAWWQAFCGYCLTGWTNHHAVVFVYGPGGNGKSVFLDTLAAVMGGYHRRAPHTLFMESIGHKHMASVADLVGSRLVTTPDVPSRASWDLGLVKSLTGGGAFKAQFMRENWFEFVPQFKLVLPGNEKPDFGGSVDKAVRRRFWLVPALHAPKTININLVDTLKLELPAVLRWMLDGWEAYNMFGGFPPCRMIERETKEYLDEMDVFGKWLQGLVKAPGDMTRHRVGDLWSSWDAFRAAEGSWKASPAKKQELTTKLREAGFEIGRDNKGAYVDQISIMKSTEVF